MAAHVGGGQTPVVPRDKKYDTRIQGNGGQWPRQLCGYDTVYCIHPSDNTRFSSWHSGGGDTVCPGPVQSGGSSMF